MKSMTLGFFLSILCALGVNAAQQEDPLNKIADDFWTWRAKCAPFTGDDVNRLERPGGTRDWSRPSIDNRRKDLAAFEAGWKKIDASGWPIGFGFVASALGIGH